MPHRKLPSRSLLAAAIAICTLATATSPDTMAATLPFTFPQPTGSEPSAEIANVTQIIVKVSGSTGSKEQSEATYIQTKVATFSATLGWNLTYLRTLASGAWVLSMPTAMTPTQAFAETNRLAISDKQIQYAHPDYVMSAQFTPNDPDYSRQWHYFVPGSNAVSGVNLPSAWDITRGQGVTVAVIDTGYTNHPDLLSNLAPGYDFISNPQFWADGNGRDADAHDPGGVPSANFCGQGNFSVFHGTHVAGTIAALGNNAQGVVGVAHQARVLPLRVLGTCGFGDLSDIADAIRWAAGGSVPGVPANANPAKVINLSLGGQSNQGCPAEYAAAINYAISQNVVVVAAAGNFNSDVANVFPASCDGVVAVAALDRNGQRAYYSSFGDGIDIAAPGGDIRFAGGVNAILSTDNNGLFAPTTSAYRFSQGTSMAAPHVSGVAALLLAQQPSLTPAQVQARLQISARPFAGNSDCTIGSCGEGMLDAHRALTSTPAQGIVINQGLTGAWFDEATSGQGFAVEVNPVNGLIYSGWYTYSETGDGQQRWYTLFGEYTPGDRSKTLRILRNTGGAFDTPPITTAVDVGTATITFQSCSRATLNYQFTSANANRSGEIVMTRLSPDVHCQLIENGQQPAAVSVSSGINEGLTAAWFEPATSGQGFQFEFMPSRGQMFTTWFTYAPNATGSGASGQRWYSISGNYAPGSLDVLGAVIYNNTGGNFDAQPPTVGQPIGTADIHIQGCYSARLDYHFNDGRTGQIPLERLTANTICLP
ncbi:MAG: S8 family peptidase [Pseudomonadota bacterium]|nr:S8 family peptidase [Pseudomonadota bacterium]